MKLDRLSADDRLMLWPDELWPQDVGALALLDGGALLDADGTLQIEKVRAAIAGRLHLVPRFRQILVEPRRGLGGPLWVDSAAFDIRDHVRVAAVAPPGDEEQLLGMVEAIRRHRLDRRRPLWELWFLTGLPHQRIGMFVRLHHVVGDGLAGVAAVGSLLDATPLEPQATPLPWTPQRAPSTGDLLADNLHRGMSRAAGAVRWLSHPVNGARELTAASRALQELVGAEPGPRTSLGRLIGAGRTFALVRGNLDDVAAIAHVNGAKINDVLLAATAIGVRRLLTSRGEPVEDLVLPMYVPVSLRRSSSTPVGGNLITQMMVRVGMHETQPNRVLREITAATAKQKSMARPALGSLFRNKLLAGVMLKLVARQRGNIVTTDLVGPAAPLYLAGARVREIFPIVNLLGTVSVGVGALSYAGQFNILLVADAKACPDLAVLADGMDDALRALRHLEVAPMYDIDQQILDEQPTAVIRGKVAVSDMATFFAHAYAVTAGAIERDEGVAIVGPPFARYRDLGEGQFEVEAGFPASRVITADGEVEPSRLPGGPVISTWHIGPYQTMSAAYEALERWLMEHDCAASEPPWEIYYSEPTTDPATWQTHVVQPYRVAATGS